MTDGSQAPSSPPPPGSAPATATAGGPWVIVGRIVLAGAAALFGMFGLGMGAMAGCCTDDTSGWPVILGWVGLSWGVALWSITLVVPAKWLPLFLLAGVGIGALEIFG